MKMGNRWPSVARAMRGALMGMGRGGVESITVSTALRAVPDGARAAGGMYSFPTPLFCGLRGLAGSVALGQGGGRGRGGGRDGGGRAPPGKTTTALLLGDARGQKEVEKVLEAARPSSPLLLTLIKDAGDMFDPQDEKKLDWLMAWTKKQTKVTVAQRNAFITQLGRRMRGEEAFDIYDRMKQAGLKPTFMTYNAMIDACAKSGGQWERAKATFEEMKAAGMKPTVITYNALISAYEMSNQWARARATFEEMQAAGCSLTSRRTSRSSLSSDNASPYSRHG